MSADFIHTGLVTVGEVATLAGVKPSAVSNWRRRHPSFPLPKESTPAGDLFDRQAVIDWLQAEGKTVVNARREIESVLWDATSQLRDAASVEDVTLLIMQLLFACRSTSRLPTVASGEITDIDRHKQTVEGFLRAVAASLPDRSYESDRALEPSSALRYLEIGPIVAVLRGLANEQIDWGATATDFLRRFHSVLGARGQGATPESVSELMVALLEPMVGVVYDPACGNAMFLAEAWRASRGSVQLFGQEISEYAWKLGWLHLALLDADFAIARGDTLRDDQFRDRKADRIALDPPLGTRSGKDLFSDERWKFGATRGSAEWMWIQHVLYHLASTGVASVLVPAGALFRGGSEARIRSEVVRSGQLDAVIELPPGLLYNSSISVALLVLQKDRGPRADRVLFVDATQLVQTRRGQTNELDASDIKRIADTVAAWRLGTPVAQPRFAVAALIDDVLEVGELSSHRFVEYSSTLLEIDGEQISTRFARQRNATIYALRGLRAMSADVEGVLNKIAGDAHDWPSIRLHELLVSKPRTGVRQETDSKGYQIPFITTGDVSSGPFRLAQLPHAVTSGNIRDRIVVRGDLLLVSRGISTDGRVGCATVDFDGEATYAESLMRIQVDQRRLLPDYLRLFFTSRQGRSALAAVTTGSVIRNLRSDALSAIELPVPDLATQGAIVEAAAILESQIASLANSLKSLEESYDTAREGIMGGILSVSQIADAASAPFKPAKRLINLEDE